MANLSFSINVDNGKMLINFSIVLILSRHTISFNPAKLLER